VNPLVPRARALTLGGGCAHFITPLAVLTRVQYLKKCPGWSHVLWTSDNIMSLKHLDNRTYGNEPSWHGEW
jgi:hypothetical protein